MFQGLYNIIYLFAALSRALSLLVVEARSRLLDRAREIHKSLSSRHTPTIGHVIDVGQQLNFRSAHLFLFSLVIAQLAPGRPGIFSVIIPS